MSPLVSMKGGSNVTDIAEEILQELQDIASASITSGYEPGPFMTVGGPTGLYSIHSPWNTECEWSPISFSALTGRGMVVASGANPGLVTLPGDGSLSIGLATSQDSNPLEAFVTVQAANNGVALPLVWQPLGRGGNIYVQITMAAGAQSAYFTVVFRRLLDKYIPDKPRQQPHTHTHSGSRMHLRKLAAQSNMVAGYEDQYPTLNGKTGSFTHGDARTVLQEGAGQNQLAPGQDATVARRGMFPLGRYKRNG